LLRRGEAARVAARRRACRLSWTEIAKLHVDAYGELLSE
jgi:hypothetical protein